jgi:DNA-directed RNA polymerase subunit M/transcription elongation factor TFIIS
LSKTLTEKEKIYNIYLNLLPKKNVYLKYIKSNKKDISNEELAEFIDNLTQKQFEKLQNFFETLPSLKKEVDFKCGKCGYEEKIEIEGIQNFFG